MAEMNLWIYSPTLYQILEATFGLLGALAALVVILLAVPTAHVLTLTSHRRLLYIIVAIAALFVLAKLNAAVGAFFHTSTFVDIAEEFAEMVAISSGAFALYTMRRTERDEVASLRRSAEVDDLTNLSSRSFFRRAAARRIELSKRNNLPLSCIVVDVDDFKPYNDRSGHTAGDEALRCVARVLRNAARADDLIARHGGEEFALLMSSDLEDAIEVAERIRVGVERECVPERDSYLKRRITVSLGVAPLAGEVKSLEQLIEVADLEMYRAKRAGKNRVSCGSS
jgi:diguanylate cyclase (GGDEF)-like protein